MSALTGVLQVSRLPEDATAAQLTMLVSQAQGEGTRRPVLERLAGVYTVMVLLSALLLATVGRCARPWGMSAPSAFARPQVPLSLCSWGDGDSHDEDATWTSRWMHSEDGTDSCVWWLRRALALVVIACPCALIIAMPVTNACGISAVARWGIDSSPFDM